MKLIFITIGAKKLGFTTFRRGDEFVEWYYWDRWYNVFQVSAPGGTLKGWCANVGLPAELQSDLGELRYVDLALDVWTHWSTDRGGYNLEAGVDQVFTSDAVWTSLGHLALYEQHGDLTWIELARSNATSARR